MICPKLNIFNRGVMKELVSPIIKTSLANPFWPYTSSLMYILTNIGIRIELKSWATIDLIATLI
jgi:hypothetical protein